MNFLSWARGLRRVKGEQTEEGSGDYSNTASTVTFDTAMQVSAFWACVKLLSETVGAMPLNCFDVTEGSKKKNTNNDLWYLLNYKPNRYQTRTEFFENIMLNLCTSGNSYCAIDRVNGKVIAVTPLMSAQMTVFLDDNGALIYKYINANNETIIYAERSIWHIKLFGNGLIGLSPMSHAAKALGVSIALEKRISVLAENGGNPAGIIKYDKMLTVEQREKIEAALNKKGKNGNNLFVLEMGMDYTQTGLSPQDMELLKNRRFQLEDIARFMGVPSVLINDLAGTTAWGSGIAQIMEGFYKLGLRPYLERIESSLKKILMDESEWQKIDIEFNFDSVLRADKKTRIETLSKGVNAGLYTPNEARLQEGLPPQDGGDVIFLNGSLQPAETLKKGDMNNEQ
jgi:HK97 family phage portal protein